MAPVGIGERLRNARTSRGLSLEDIEAETRIQRRYLDALEREAWDELPGATYAKGFLRTYARQLGLSPDEIVGLYPVSPGASASMPSPVEVRITPATPRSRLRRVVTAIVVVFLAGAVALAYVLYGQLRQFAATRPRPAAVRSAPGGVAPPAPGGPSAPGTRPSATPVTPTSQGQPGGKPAGAPPAATTPAGQPVPVAPNGRIVVVSVQATDRSWVRTVADGVTVFEGFLSAGDRQVWQGRQVSIRIGNASALDVAVNGQPLGRLGNPGDVVDRTFTAGAPATPGQAPVITPTSPAVTPAPATTPTKVPTP